MIAADAWQTIQKNCMKRYVLFLVVLTAGCGQPQTGIVFPEGGYPYVQTIHAADSNYYVLPVKPFVPRRDSFMYEDGYMLYKAFDEPNISLRPLAQPVFRYFTHLHSHDAMIILTGNGMIVKEGVHGYIFPDEDRNRLTHEERLRYALLSARYPLYDKPYRPSLKKYVDSMIKAFPRITDPSYYRYLMNKARIDNNFKFIYSTRKIQLTPERYKYLVDAINSSGYWKAPLMLPCTGDRGMDTPGYILEANTPNRYNLMSFTYCSDTSSPRIIDACHELDKYALRGK